MTTATEAVRLYTIPETAEMLGASQDTVRRRIKSSALRAIDIGDGRSKTRVRADDLQHFIDSRTPGQANDNSQHSYP